MSVGWTGRDGDKKCEELMKGHGAVFTTRYGVCYMFDAAAKNGGSIVSNYGGPNFGLELLIDMESEHSIFNQPYQTSTTNSNNVLILDVKLMTIFPQVLTSCAMD